MANVSDTLKDKVATIERILSNKVYAPNSGMYKQLAAQLVRLPLDTLRNLAIIIDCKK